MDCNYYVLHVKEGFTNREKSIIEQFARLELPFEWVLDYDKDELSDDVLERYGYSGSLRKEEISCCLKHITAWERIARGPWAGGFVFEDDILIDVQNFKAGIQKAILELNTHWQGHGCISLGNAMAFYVPWTKRKKDRLLYQADFIRATDSYWLTKALARKMVEWIMANGFSLPADHLVDRINMELEVPMLWLAPTLISQGSHTGLFASSIQNQERGKWFDRIEWRIKIFRRKYLYPLMGIDLRKK